MQDNLEAVISVLQFIYDNIMYAELNTKSDYCQVCGYDGEIKIVEDDGKLVWECPKCGNRDQNKLNVARRTCAISAPSSGIRAARRRSRTACCIYNYDSNALHSVLGITAEKFFSISRLERPAGRSNVFSPEGPQRQASFFFVKYRNHIMNYATIKIL